MLQAVELIMDLQGIVHELSRQLCTAASNQHNVFMLNETLSRRGSRR
jgi:hypothetical protein